MKRALLATAAVAAVTASFGGMFAAQSLRSEPSTVRNPDVAATTNGGSTNAPVAFHGLFLDFESLAALVESSGAVVEGVFIDEREEWANIPAARGAAGPTASRIDLIRRFRITTSYSLEIPEDSIIEVWWTKSLTLPGFDLGPPVTQKVDVEALRPGKAYTLFLHTAHLSENVPVWALSGSPAVAETRGRGLSFIVTDGYVERNRAAGNLLGSARIPDDFKNRSVPELSALLDRGRK
jgi:hypothetical protein